MPGLKMAMSYADESSSAAGPQITWTPCVRRLSKVDLSRFFSSALSSTVTCGTFRSEEKRRRASAEACTEHGDILIFVARVFHLSFSVAKPNRAKMIDRIQNRTITVLSFQPVVQNDDAAET